MLPLPLVMRSTLVMASGADCVHLKKAATGESLIMGGMGLRDVPADGVEIRW